MSSFLKKVQTQKRKHIHPNGSSASLTKNASSAVCQNQISVFTDMNSGFGLKRLFPVLYSIIKRFFSKMNMYLKIGSNIVVDIKSTRRDN